MKIKKFVKIITKQYILENSTKKPIYFIIQTFKYKLRSCNLPEKHNILWFFDSAHTISCICLR